MTESKWPVAVDDADFDPYLEARPESSRDLFWRFVALARACGPVIFELQKGPIVLRGTRRIFAGVKVTADGLHGHINLARELSDRRILKAEAFTKRLYFHCYPVTALDDLDEEFAHWLCEARDVGDGLYLSSPS